MPPKKKKLPVTKPTTSTKKAKLIVHKDNCSYHSVNQSKVERTEHAKSLTCKINGMPRPQHRCIPLKSGRMVNAYSEHTKSFKIAFCKALQQANETIFSMSGNPIKATVKFYFARPHKHFQQLKMNQPVLPNAPVYFTNAPDIDNLQKLILDAMQNTCYENDKVVAHVKAAKLYDPMHKFWMQDCHPSGATTIKVQEMVEDKYEENCHCESCKSKRK